MIKEIRHFGIVVKDLKESLQFYTEKLGFVISKQMNESGAFINTVLGLENLGVTTVKITLNDGQMIELLDFQTHKNEQIFYAINDIGPTHLAFTVSDVEKFYKEYGKKGVEFISAPAISPDGYAKVVFCKAPEGTYIELVEILSASEV